MASTTAASEFHVIIWGATGFTGKLACEYLARSYGLPSDTFKYAIAARTQSRLDQLETTMLSVAKAQNKTNGAVSVPKIVASVDDEAAMTAMAKRTACVCALAGPYSLCGEPVLKACAENGTHYVDITGETNWVAKMRETYNSKAVANKAKIVNMVLVPSELSMVCFAKHCKENNLEMKNVTFHMDIEHEGVSGGTMRSIMGMCRSLSWGAFQQFISDPYAFCNQRPAEAIVQASKSQWYSLEFVSLAKRWSSDGLFSPMASYLRMSNEMQNYPWGRDCIFLMKDTRQTVWGAVLQMVVSWMMPFLLYLMAQLRIEMFWPESGKATFQPDVNSKTGRKYFDMWVEGDLTDKTSKSSKKVSLKVHCPYELYHFIAMSTIESSMCAALDETPPMYGVVPPSGALGLPFQQRFEKQSCTFSFTS